MFSDHSTIKLKINNKKITHTFGNLNILVNNLNIKIKQCKLWQRGFNSCKWLALFAKLGLVRRTWLGRWYSCWVLAFYDSSLSSSLQVTASCLQTNEQKHLLLLPHSSASLFFPYKNLPADCRGGREHTFVEGWLCTRCWDLGHTDRWIRHSLLPIELTVERGKGILLHPLYSYIWILLHHRIHIYEIM